MGWRGEDRVTGVKNDSAVLRVSGKKMSGEKAISMIQIISGIHFLSGHMGALDKWGHQTRSVQL